jgi:hypothetical protein
MVNVLAKMLVNLWNSFTFKMPEFVVLLAWFTDINRYKSD